jgi:hypothetical protein
MSFESSLFKHHQIVCHNRGDYSQQKSEPVSRHIFLVLAALRSAHALIATIESVAPADLGQV